MKRVLISGAILIAVGAFLVLNLGASNNSANGTYKVEFDNAFGLVQGADFKVAGVRAGTIEKIDLVPGCINGNPAACKALVTVQVTQPGFGEFHADAFCQSRPQSLIGEYFVDCQPGHAGKVLKPGSTIPVKNTQSTIPADLLANVMRMPYRERLTLIINELGATTAGRSGDLQAALQRAVPALTQTDNLLHLLANDSGTLQQLTANSDAVITALANNSAQVKRFITEAGNTATDTATQSRNLQATLQKLPGFFEQLKPALQKLGVATDANLPVLANLNAASGQLNRLFTNLPPFSRSAIPAVKSLGKASVTGKSAVEAANPTIAKLNQFAQPTPELGQNLSIVLHDLDNRSRAVEADTRSPGGQGYTGLEALLQYVFIQPLAINTYGPFGHQLAVDGFIDTMCTPYATPATIAMSLKSFGPSYRRCYGWLGPNQPGVNVTDPSNPGAAVPDPGGAPPGERGPTTSAAKLSAALAKGKAARNAGSASSPAASTGSGSAASGSTGTAAGGAASTAGSAGSGGSGSGGSPGSGGGTSVPPINLQKTVGQVLSLLGGGASGGGTQSPGSAQSGNGAQQLLNYLLAP